MNNTAIVRAFRKDKCKAAITKKQHELRFVEKEIRRLERRGNKIQDDIFQMQRVSAVYDGVPFQNWGSYWTHVALDTYTYKRVAQVYVPVFATDRWALNLGDRIGSTASEERSAGMFWKDVAAVNEAAYRWVVYGEVPANSGRKDDA